MQNSRKSIFDGLDNESHILKLPVEDVSKKIFLSEMKALQEYEMKRKKSRLVWLEKEQRIALLVED